MSIEEIGNPIVVTGATGQVGAALTTVLYDQVVSLDRTQCDLSRPETLAAVMDEIQPGAIINAAAYTQVDKAEEEEALATVINGESPGVLAAYCAEKKIPFVHYSTDYVFDGTGDNPRREDEPCQPLGAYGRSKLAGEQAVQAAGGQSLILRTSWIYDAWGKNFLNTMLRLGAEREVLRIVADQVGAPSFAQHLALSTVDVLAKALKMERFPSGIYHFCNGGTTTWHAFAEAIFAEARKYGDTLKVDKVIPITTEEFPTPAKRPQNSRLSMEKLEQVFGLVMPDWHQGLVDCMAARYSTNQKNKQGRGVA